jgi:MFS-type transporter involved in bile tolerance (Atg22 family)
MIFFGRLENSKSYNPITMLVVGYALFIVVACGLLTVKDIHHFYIVQLLLAFAMGILTPAARITYARAQKREEKLANGAYSMVEIIYLSP